MVIHWGISSFFGWGVYGLNLALQWGADPEVQPVSSRTIRTADISLDPLRRAAFETFLHDSAAFEQALRQQCANGADLRLECPLLTPLGDDFDTLPTSFGTRLDGSPTVGVTFFENPRLSEEAIGRARRLPRIVTGSSWNESILRGLGIDRVTTVLQGIDPTLFHPAPRSGLFADTFLVFSGGKLEFRKGQDLVLAAFREFARNHPDAVLVTAWHSPWPQAARSLDASGHAGPVPMNPEGRVDVGRWALQNGIPAGQFLDLGSIPNAQLPPILREIDVAVFPNRGEGGTNLVAMECMACGVPTILSANTGHLDIADPDYCFPLLTQGTVSPGGQSGPAISGWGESSVDEIVEHLERIHSDRKEAARRGAAAASRLADLTWRHTAQALKRVVLDIPVRA